jgi:hypothetical protein
VAASWTTTSPASSGPSRLRIAKGSRYILLLIKTAQERVAAFLLEMSIAHPAVIV